MRSLCARGAALAFLALLGLAVSVYPAPGWLLGGALALYLGLLFWRPELWLLAVPVLLPVLDFAPWTGWFFLEELDLLLLATCVAGYWQLGRQPAPTKLPGAVRLALALFVLCYLVAGWRGVMPLAPLDANAFSNYVSPYNGLRVLKGVLWPLLLLPVLRHTAGAGGENLQRWLVPGMLLGLLACSLAVVWERLAFPGLFNFASDYRPTAPFSAMHTGGAALDAYLAMAFPFVAMFLVGRQPHWRLALGLGGLALGVFAGLTTFSRDIYLAYAAAGGVIAVLGAANHVRAGTLARRTLLGNLLLLCLAYWILTQVFAVGGYRALAAALGLLATALLLAGAAPRLPRPGLAAGLALLLLAVVAAIGLLAPGAASPTSKLAYIAYGLAAVCAGAGCVLLALGPARAPLGVLLLAVALPAQALASALVARHYGGNEALPGSALGVLLAVALAASRALPRPPWKLERGTLTVAFFSAIVFAALVPVAGSYHTGSRFATVGDDVALRLRHWGKSLGMMDDDGLTAAFGQGLGRYPATYLWKNTQGEMPGTFVYVDEPGNRYLRLGAAQRGQSYGEVLRLLQRVDTQPGKRYRLQLDVRSQGAPQPAMAVCERWLIYSQECLAASFARRQAAPGWQTMTADLPVRRVANSWGAPLVLDLWNESTKAALEVDNISLRELDTGRELVANGSFADGHTRWFFSSDRNHMPWHVKNFAVNQVFELGWVGALATAFLLLAVGGGMVARGLGGDTFAAVCLAGMTGCMMVGLFDSITDVPRLTLLFLLLALAGSLKPARQRIKVRRQRAGQEEADALMP